METIKKVLWGLLGANVLIAVFILLWDEVLLASIFTGFGVIIAGYLGAAKLYEDHKNKKDKK